MIRLCFLAVLGRLASIHSIVAIMAGAKTPSTIVPSLDLVSRTLMNGRQNSTWVLFIVCVLLQELCVYMCVYFVCVFWCMCVICVCVYMHTLSVVYFACTHLHFCSLCVCTDGDYTREIKRCLLLGKKAMTNLDSVLKKAETSLCQKGPYNQSYGFFSSHVWMWELDHKEGWALKNWCFQIVVQEKTLESPLDCKEIKPVSPKGNQSWIY